MSFPDIGTQDNEFQMADDANNLGFNFGPSDEQPNTQEEKKDSPIMDFMGYNNNNPMNNPEEFDEEEQQRIAARNAEAEERRKKIEEKMELELKAKNENREKAIQFMNDFEAKRKSNIEKRKVQNGLNEKEFLENKKLVKEGKKNPWETVVDNIAVKESDYKGSNDVSRMRSVIIARKNDANHI